jgi:hypothetical protein
VAAQLAASQEGLNSLNGGAIFGQEQTNKKRAKSVIVI